MPMPVPDVFERILDDLMRTFSARGVALWRYEVEQASMRRIAARGSSAHDPFVRPVAAERLPNEFAITLEEGEPRSLRLAGLFDERETLILILPLFQGNCPTGLVALLVDPDPLQDDADVLERLFAESLSLSQIFSMQADAPRLETKSLDRAVGVSILPEIAPRSTLLAPAPFDFVLSLQRSLDLDDVTNVVANDGRLLWNVDRVSVAVRRGRRVDIMAVSGQESVHPRGNLVRLMRRLAELVVATGEVFRFDGSSGSVPPQLEEPLAEFVQEAGSRFIMIVPLIEPERLVPPEAPPGLGKVPKVERRAIGALIIEQMASSQPTNALQQSLDSTKDHIAAAIYNARAYSSIFMLPTWRAIGRFREWLRGRRLATAIAILLSIGAFAIALALVPWEYRIDGTGRLMPVEQREIFAPWDGEITELLVAGGDRVEVGQVLLKLRNDELSTELVTLENELREKRKLLASLAAQRDDAEKQGKQEQIVELQGKSVEARVEIEGGTLQREILKERIEQLTAKAPIAGVVTTFQVEQLLMHRPVKRGDVLLQIMDDRGAWQLELEIAENRVGRVLNAQAKPTPRQTPAGNAIDSHHPVSANSVTELKRKTDTRGLAIEYRLLTQPESSYSGYLTQLSTRAATTETTGTVLEARAALDEEKLPPHSIGAEVRARIGCGPSTLGDVLFGDVIEFVQRYLWW